LPGIRPNIAKTMLKQKSPTDPGSALRLQVWVIYGSAAKVSWRCPRWRDGGNFPSKYQLHAGPTLCGPFWSHHLQITDPTCPWGRRAVAALSPI
jgi:hypothetical protein